MYDYILTFLIGAAVPITINSLQRLDERKKFELERKDKYKLIAIEKRLEAHQQAYFLWDKLIHIIHEKDFEKKNNIISEAREFWFQNNLYLEPKTRNDFNETIFRVSMHSFYLQANKDAFQGEDKTKTAKEVKDNWDFILELGSTIQKDVQLEPIILKIDINEQSKELKEE